jgi:hypothetical protein
MRMHQAAVVDGILERLAKTPPSEARQDLVSALCRLHFHEGVWKGDSWGTRPDTRGPYYQPEAWSETPKIAAALKAELEKSSPQDTPALARELRRNRIEFNETLGRLLTLAENDPALLPDLVEQLASAATIPAAGLPLLVKAAKSELPADTLAKVVAVLGKIDSAEAVMASIAALDRLASLKDAGRELGSALKAFLDAPKLENHHQMLEELAASIKGTESGWADAALLALGA